MAPWKISVPEASFEVQFWFQRMLWNRLQDVTMQNNPGARAQPASLLQAHIAIVFGSIRWCVWSFRPSSPLRLPHLKCLLLLLCMNTPAHSRYDSSASTMEGPLSIGDGVQIVVLHIKVGWLHSLLASCRVPSAGRIVDGRWCRVACLQEGTLGTYSEDCRCRSCF